jgi:hypothetical protein
MEVLLLCRIYNYLDLFHHISEVEYNLEQFKEEEKMNIFMGCMLQDALSHKKLCKLTQETYLRYTTLLVQMLDTLRNKYKGSELWFSQWYNDDFQSCGKQEAPLQPWKLPKSQRGIILKVLSLQVVQHM